MITQTEIDRLRALAVAATPGIVRHNKDSEQIGEVSTESGHPLLQAQEQIGQGHKQRDADAAYATAAWNALPTLLDALEAAQRDSARCHRFIDEMCNETFDTWTNGYRMQQVALNIQAAMKGTP